MVTSVCLSREPGRRSTGGLLLFVLTASKLAWVGFHAVHLQLEDAYACFEGQLWHLGDLLARLANLG